MLTHYREVGGEGSVLHTKDPILRKKVPSIRTWSMVCPVLRKKWKKVTCL